MSIVDDLIEAFEDLIKVVKFEFQQKDARIAELEARLDEARRSNPPPPEIKIIEPVIPRDIIEEELETGHRKYKKWFKCADCGKDVKLNRRYYPGWKPRCDDCLRIMKSIVGVRNIKAAADKIEKV